jgi:hypothetical protein
VKHKLLLWVVGGGFGRPPTRRRRVEAEVGFMVWSGVGGFVVVVLVCCSVLVVIQGFGDVVVLACGVVVLFRLPVCVVLFDSCFSHCVQSC